MNYYQKTYQLYSLIAASELALPEVTIAPPDQAPDISIRLGSVPQDGLPGATQLGPFCQADTSRLWLQVPEVARYLVEDGERITIDPLPGVDEASIRVFLLGSCIGALLFQRGFLVLHGNAIRVGDACLICAGDSGAGKSTLATSFLKRGHEILADDVIAVNAQGLALPGFPRIKLWQDAADQLGIDTRELLPIRPQLKKFHLPLGKHFCTDPLPIRWMYVLHTRNQSGFALESVRGMARFEPLWRNTYRVRYMEGMALQAEHLKRCGELASKIRLSYVYRAQAGLSPMDLAGALLDDALERLSAA